MSDCDDDEVRPVIGDATPAHDDDDDDDAPPLATFWLPDPTSRSGWGMRHVWKKADDKPKRGIGFNR